MTISIIGLGLIGGSMALALREADWATQVWGVENHPAHARLAQERGLADKIVSLEEALQGSEMLVLAVPVDVCLRLLPQILDDLPASSVVSDVGSTKSALCRAIVRHPRRSQFVAAHPIAGTENSGPGAAIPHLFTNKMTILCEKAASSPEAWQQVRAMYEALGMTCLEMEAEAHDQHLAYVSHLSHLTSFALALTVLEVEKSEKNIFQLAGSGFSSTARLAQSAPGMWTPIFTENRHHLLTALDEYEAQLRVLRQAIAQADGESLHKALEKANAIRSILNPS
ncbi:MAG: prephenate dehydrogenase [Microscillaceae bacterium]|nr:prephenate dehydrogenase [Microscillaceae bacterium]